MRRPRTVIVRQLELLACLLSCLVMPALLCTPTYALNPNRNISQYAHAVWRMQEGFFNGKVNAIAQTADGYLWFGTRMGLLRFDGVRFVPWTPPDGAKLPSLYVHALLGARDGSLWIGTRGGLFHWKDEKLVRISDFAGTAVSILQDRKGDIWIVSAFAGGTTGPICRVDVEKSRCFFSQADAVPADTPNGESLVEDMAGNLWMGTQKLLFRWKEGSTGVYRPHGLESNNSAGIVALAALPDGSMLVGMGLPGPGLGLERLIDGVWKPFVTPQLDGRTLSVTSLLLDRDGALWIGTVDQGLYHYYNGRVDQFRRTDGLSSDFISQLSQDKEGTVWVVTPGGVDSFHDLSIATWSARDGLTTDNVASVATAHDGTVWIGNAGGLDAIKDGRVSSIRPGNGLPGNQIRGVFEDREERLWVGVDNDLTIMARGQFTKILRPDGTPIGPVEDMTEDLQNNLWVELEAGRGLLRIRDLKVQEEFPAPATPPAHALAADSKGNLWLGLDSGNLAWFRNGHSEVIEFPHGAGSRVRQVIANPDGSILAASNAGMLAWKDGRALILGVRNGLPCEGINGVVLDGRGNLWLHTACGVIEIEQPELQRWWTHPESAVQFRYLDVLDGALPGNAFYNPAARSRDGRLWFANGNVLQMVDPSSLARNPITPPMHVEEIVADRRHYSPEGVVRLPRLTRDLEIDFTALSFVAPKKMQFRYRLDGHDKDWQDSGTRRQAFYTDLGPGSYQFRVIACNNDGVWNGTGAVVAFYIVPAFYQTSWFRTLCAIAASAGLCMFYLIHLRRATRRIQEQLAARLEERERIARELHDTLLQGFQGLMLRFQSVLKNIPAEGPARQMMESTLDRADEVLLEGRQRVHDLREENMTGNGLWDNLARWGKELAQDSNTRFRAAIIGTPQPLDPTVCDEVYQIGREALTNAFQHAVAKQIELEIAYDRKKVKLLVRDDGAGIDNGILKGGRSGHWGLSGMRERSQKIGAQLNIWSHGGAGTEIDLSIPAKVAYRCPGKRSAQPRLKKRAEEYTEWTP
jgi:ligand-binding sensor domain-containing protein